MEVSGVLWRRWVGRRRIQEFVSLSGGIFYGARRSPTQNESFTGVDIRFAAISTPDRLNNVVPSAESGVGTNETTIREMIGSRICAVAEDNGAAHQLWHDSSLLDNGRLNRCSGTHRNQ